MRLSNSVSVWRWSCATNFGQLEVEVQCASTCRGWSVLIIATATIRTTAIPNPILLFFCWIIMLFIYKIW
jgi:hypothetical protein